MKVLVDVKPVTPELETELADLLAQILRAEFAQERTVTSPAASDRDINEPVLPVEVITQ